MKISRMWKIKRSHRWCVLVTSLIVQQQVPGEDQAWFVELSKLFLRRSSGAFFFLLFLVYMVILKLIDELRVKELPTEEEEKNS